VFDAAIRAEDEDGGRAADIQPANQVQVGFRVYLQVRYPVGHTGYLGQHPAGGPARRAEGRGELQQRGARAERPAEFRVGKVRPGARAARARPAPGAPASGWAAGIRLAGDCLACGFVACGCLLGRCAASSGLAISRVAGGRLSGDCLAGD
jgi:hypothetical protein